LPLPLTTERLLLRPATLDDLDAWHAISRDAEEAWWGAPSSTLDDARAGLGNQIRHQEEHGFGLWAVVLRAKQKVIGAAGLVHLAGGPEIEVGYRFLRTHWGTATRPRPLALPSSSGLASSASNGSWRSRSHPTELRAT
jgi:RimJ/RimL family protein N-acetyltransferase